MVIEVLLGIGIILFFFFSPDILRFIIMKTKRHGESWGSTDPIAPNANSDVWTQQVAMRAKMSGP